jgi:hypothetical protein
VIALDVLIGDFVDGSGSVLIAFAMGDGPLREGSGFYSRCASNMPCLY